MKPILPARPLLGALLLLGLAASCADGRGAASSAAMTTTCPDPGDAGGCVHDADCAGSPDGAVCDAATGACVLCLPGDDTCPAGQYCVPSTHACAPGCEDDADCAANPTGHLECDPGTHQCVGCVTSDDCPLGQICQPGVQMCVAGCSPTHACAMGYACCGSTCHDLSTDFEHCGDCATACTNPPNAIGACTAGACQIGKCLAAFADCDGQAADGCERNVLYDGPCTCTPGATQPCYQGAPGTEGVGPCKGGTSTCAPSGLAWGPCVGQVLPIFEICSNGIDDDCDGIVDDVPDVDGDGWTVCDNDCCEEVGPACSTPALVNPGAYEVVGDGVDNDCNPATSDTTPPPPCSVTQNFTGVTAVDIAQAMDLCLFTTANPPLAMRTWGVVDAELLLADGSTPSAVQLANIQDKQVAILEAFGTGGVVPTNGPTMAGLSSGLMRGEVDPGYNPAVNHNPGTGFSLMPVAPPAVYTAQHGGKLAPGHCGGTTCPTGSGAFDSVDVRLTIRVPTNAFSFSYDFRFFSAEYQSYQCTAYNDYYLALLTSGAAGIPADHDISFDALHNPVSVNNGFFQVCGGNGMSCGTCPSGTGALAGTGLELVNTGTSGPTGGGTLWLTTDAPVVPGETMQLDLTIFDVSDDVLDSMVLLDNFRWSVLPAAVGTHS
jgi:Putative metal-binding motif